MGLFNNLYRLGSSRLSSTSLTTTSICLTALSGLLAKHHSRQVRVKVTEIPMTISKASRKCVFCDRSLVGNKSEEHIFSDWLQKYLGIKKQRLFPTLYTAEGKVDKYWGKTFNGYVGVHICKRCNNGWMSRLEEDTKPLLISLIDGTCSGILAVEQTQLLSFWIYKTALALHTASIQDMFIPASHYHTVNERNAIPAQVFVAIAQVTEPDEFLWIQNRNWSSFTHDIPAKNLEDSYKVTFRLKQLAARVHYWPSKERYMHDFFGDSIAYIWSNGPRSIKWPLTRSDVKTIQEFEESVVIGNKIDHSK
jgi:hypothetical protein